MVNATFNTISVIMWLSDLLMEEMEENHKPAASHWQIWSHNVISSTLLHEWDNICVGYNDCLNTVSYDELT